MDNRGAVQFAPLILPVVLGLIAIIATITFIASPVIRNILIGVALFGSAVYVVGTVKDDRVKTTFIILALVFGVSFIYLSPVLNTTFAVSSVTLLGEGDIVRILATPGSENSIVSLDANELNGKLSGLGWSVDRGVRIEMETEYVEKSFDLRNDGTPFYYLRKIDTGNEASTFLTVGSSSLQEYLTKCRERLPGKTIVYAYQTEVGFGRIPNVNCIYKEQIGTKGSPAGGSITDYSILIQAGGDSQTITRTNTQARLLNGNIVANLEGSINAPQSINSVPFDVYYSNDGQARYLINSGSLGAQSSALSNFLSRVNFESATTTESALSSHSSTMNNILQSKTNEFASDVRTSTPTISGDRLEVRAITDIPLISFDVKGSYLGIEKLSGQPEITSCLSDIDAQVGEDGLRTGTFTVKNIGSQDGTFLIEPSCSGTGIELITTSSATIADGSSKTFNAQLTYPTGEQGDIKQGSCTINVKDRNSGASDSCSFGYRLEYETEIENIPIIDEEVIEDGQCPWYQQLATTTEKDYGAFYWRAYTPGFDPIENEIEFCRTADWVYLMVGAGVVLILGVYLIRLWNPNIKRRKRK